MATDDINNEEVESASQFVGEAEFVGRMPIKQDVEVIPADNRSLYLGPTADKDGYFTTGVKDDHPLLGKENDFFNYLIGKDVNDADIEEEILGKYQASSIRVNKYGNPQHMDAHMGRVTIHLAQDEKTIIHTYLECYYTKWRINWDEPVVMINPRGISRLTLNDGD